MGTRTKRLLIAVTLTFVDAFACYYYCGVIWREFALDPFARGALLGLLGLWIASAVVIWLHVGHDLRLILRERRERLAFDTLTSAADLRRDTNV
jgi:hypothetical protein